MRRESRETIVKDKSILSQSEKFEVADYIRKRIKRQPGGTFKYIDDWSDARIAVHFGFTEHNVRAVCMAAFGSLIRYSADKKPKPEDNTGAGILKRIDKIESAVRALCEEWGVDYE